MNEPDYTILDKAAQSVLGKKARKSLTNDDVPDIVDDELRNLGWSSNARLSLLGNLGRENSWNLNTIFAGHDDPDNKKYNRGIISWQDSRQTDLQNYIQSNGGDFAPNENNIRLMTRFMDHEMQNSRDLRVKKWRVANQALKNPNISLSEASKHLTDYIAYEFTDPKTGIVFNTRDNEYGSLNNRKWAEKAKKRGLGTLPDYSQLDKRNQTANFSGLDTVAQQVLGRTPETPGETYPSIADVHADWQSKGVLTPKVQTGGTVIAPKTDAPIVPTPKISSSELSPDDQTDIANLGQLDKPKIGETNFDWQRLNQPLTLRGEDGKTWTESGSGIGLQSNQKRVVGDDGNVKLAEKTTDKDGKETWSMRDEVAPVAKQNRTLQTQAAQTAQPTIKSNSDDAEYKAYLDYKGLTDTAETRAQFNRDLSENKNFGSDVQIEARTDEENKTIESEKPRSINDVTIRVPVSKDKPIREAITEATKNKIFELGYDVEAQDIDAALQKNPIEMSGGGRITDTQLSEAAEQGYISNTIGKELIRDAIKAKDERLIRRKTAERVLLQKISTGTEISDEERADFNKFGLTDKEISEAFINPANKDAVNQGVKTKELFDAWSEGYQNQGDLSSIAQIKAARDVGWLTDEKANELIFKETESEKTLRESLNYRQSSPVDGQPQPSSIRFKDAEQTQAEMQKILAENGSYRGALERQAKEAKDEEERKARVAEKSAYRPLYQPLEFAKNLSRVVPNAVSSILKTVDIAREAVPFTNPIDAYDALTTGFSKPASQRELYALGKKLDSFVSESMPKDKDLQNDFLTSTVPDAVGQVLVQLGLGIITGGATAPVLLGAAQGAAEQNEAAEKGGATQGQRLLAAAVGGIAAVPDAIPFTKWLAPLGEVERLGFVRRLLNSVFTNAAEEVGEKEALEVSRSFLKNTLLNLGKNTKTVGVGMGLEGIQETLEKKTNDAVASLTYDPNRKVLVLDEQDLQEFIGGAIGGVAGGVSEIKLENNVRSKQSESLIPNDLQPRIILSSQSGTQQTPAIGNEIQSSSTAESQTKVVNPVVGSTVEVEGKGRGKITKEINAQSVAVQLEEKGNVIQVRRDKIVPVEPKTSSSDSEVGSSDSRSENKLKESENLNTSKNDVKETEISSSDFLKDTPNSATIPAHDAATSPNNNLPEPSEAQIEAGNYKKGHINVNGLNISVEIPVGGTRKGIDRNGKAWSRTMQSHYGYIKRTVGADTENIDVFIKDHTPEEFSGDVYVVDQIHPDTGKFDEHKVLLGFSNEREAREAYAANYADGWKGLKTITNVPFDKFKEWTNEEQSKPVSSGEKPDNFTQENLNA